MNQFLTMGLVAITAIAVYEVIGSLAVYLLRDKIRMALNIFLGRGRGFNSTPLYEHIDASIDGMNKRIESQNEVVYDKISEVLKGMRTLQRTVADNQNSATFMDDEIRKLKLTKANTSALKKLTPNKTVVKKTSKKPVKKTR